jgi:hypothetical protein
MEAEVEWIPVSDAAPLLGCSVHTVRRKAKVGELPSTSDPDVLKAVPKGRGRPPKLLVSVQGISELRVTSDLERAGAGSADQECRERLIELETERVRLLAEVARLKEVVRLSLVREDLQSQADAARREQLSQFIVPDFPND